MKKLIEAARDQARGSSTPETSFQEFDSRSELWLDYLETFRTFLTANSIPKEKDTQAIPYLPDYSNLQVILTHVVTWLLNSLLPKVLMN